MTLTQSLLSISKLSTVANAVTVVVMVVVSDSHCCPFLSCLLLLLWSSWSLTLTLLTAVSVLSAVATAGLVAEVVMVTD